MTYIPAPEFSFNYKEHLQKYSLNTNIQTNTTETTKKQLYGRRKNKAYLFSIFWLLFPNYNMLFYVSHFKWKGRKAQPYLRQVEPTKHAPLV